MDKEEIIKMIMDEVSKEFGAERIKDIESRHRGREQRQPRHTA